MMLYSKGVLRERGSVYASLHLRKRCLACLPLVHSDESLVLRVTSSKILVSVVHAQAHPSAARSQPLLFGARASTSIGSVRMNTAIGAAAWVVGKALAPVTDGLLEAWGASKELGTNIKDLQLELLLVKGILENARGKQLDGSALEELLQKLQEIVCNAEDVLDELDYFRIQDRLQSTCDAADKHPKGCGHNLVFNAHHTTKAVGRLFACSSAASPGNPGEEDVGQRVLCYAWPRARQRACGNSSSAPNTNQLDGEASGCMRKLVKLLPCSSFQPVRDDVGDDDSGKSIICGACMRNTQPQRNHAVETPKLMFNRVDISRRMMGIVKQLRPLREAVTIILQGCRRSTGPDITQSRPITTSESTEPKLYGRDVTVNSVIHDITKGKYCGKLLTVLPIVGDGGIGKTTLTQHIYQSQEVQSHFQVKVWICVSSLSFNPTRLIEEIKGCIPKVEGGKEGTAGELIQQRLKSKRFLLILDDMWECSNEDDWKKLLLPFKKSQEMSSIILVTTRIPKTAQMVKTTDSSIELGGLDTEEFRKLFLAFVFGDEQSCEDHIVLLDTGEKIMKKLKGSPLAAKTVGRLLRKHLDFGHWTRVLESKQWEMETSTHDIIPALRLSYDNLPFHLQQCFSSCSLFPEDYKFGSEELIHFWIGLDILRSDGENRNVEHIGQSNLDGLVSFGFFKKHDGERNPHYTLHDLLHELALKVSSHECLSLHLFNVGSVEIRPSVRHLSIIVDAEHDSDGMTDENFESRLREVVTTSMAKNLRTLMIFGELDGSFQNIFGYLFREANALRLLHLPNMSFPVESMLHNFSALVHLRYLLLTSEYGSEMHLPSMLSRFYHLKILDLQGWHGSLYLPGDICNLEKLRHFLTQDDELHAAISNVGKLLFLQELKKFQVGKESESFEPAQLGHLRDLRELGIYNLENIHTKEAADQAKLMDKTQLHTLTLDWESNTEPNLEAPVLESLRPHNSLQELRIRGHGDHSCPTWLGTKLSVKALKSLHLVRLAWKNLPSLGQMWVLQELTLEGIATLEEFGPNHFGRITEQSFCRLKRLKLQNLQRLGKWVAEETLVLFSSLQVLIIGNCPELLELPSLNNIHWFPSLQRFEIKDCPKLLALPPVPWTETLCSVNISGVGSKILDKLVYSKTSSSAELRITGKDDMHSLDQLLVFSKLAGLQELEVEKCPPLELKHLLMLTSLKRWRIQSSNALIVPSVGHGDVEWQRPVEHIEITGCGASGRELTELLPHLPKLSILEIYNFLNITRLVVGVDMQQTIAPASSSTSLDVKTEDTEAKDEQQKIAEEEFVGEEEKEEGEKEELVGDGEEGEKEDAVEEEAATAEEEEDGLLVFPANLCDSLQQLTIVCLRQRIVISPLNSLQALRTLWLWDCELASFSSSGCPFPSSLQVLYLTGTKCLKTLEPPSNLTSLTGAPLKPQIGEDLRCESLWYLLTHGQLSELWVRESPNFFAGWDPARGLEDEEGQLLISRSCKLRDLNTDDVKGVLTAPICSLLSSSLIKLVFTFDHKVERFTKEQEEALHLLTSLQELQFRFCTKLHCLPAGLHKLTNLNRLEIRGSPEIRSLPKDGLPSSLQELWVSSSSEELKQCCRRLKGTIPKIIIDLRLI